MVSTLDVVTHCSADVPRYESKGFNAGKLASPSSDSLLPDEIGALGRILRPDNVCIVPSGGFAVDFPPFTWIEKFVGALDGRS